MDARSAIGKRLAMIREHRRMSQTDLAAAIGVTICVCAYEHGRITITATRFDQLARAFAGPAFARS